MRKILFILLLSGCVSREVVEGQLWMFDQLPQDICIQYPELRKKGVIRKISCKDFYNEERCSRGQETYIVGVSYCADRIKTFKAAEDVYIQQWLNKLGRPKK